MAYSIGRAKRGMLITPNLLDSEALHNAIEVGPGSYTPKTVVLKQKQPTWK